jgi:hypothetical protein
VKRNLEFLDSSNGRSLLIRELAERNKIGHGTTYASHCDA